MTPQELSDQLCECGCGEFTFKARKTASDRGHVKGQPLRFITGHNSLGWQTRYEVDTESGCWGWQGKKDPDGYGRMGSKVYGEQRAHRAFYRLHGNAIPANMQLDHLCRNRACVNPDHLEVVTLTENVRRGESTKLPQYLVEEIKGTTKEEIPNVYWAKWLGVTDSLICVIRGGGAWKDIGAAEWA